MEDQRKISEHLDQIQRPGFLVKDNLIQSVNQAAQAMLLSPGQEFPPMLLTGREEYATFQEGEICLTLSIAGMEHGALITRIDKFDLVVLDTQEEEEEFRFMSLVSMELREPLMQAISSARQHNSDAKMNHSLMKMLRMVNNMADISRYTASARMELRDVDSFLLELFEKAATLTEDRAQIIFEGLRQPVFSLIDPEQLERAVWNMLSNCVKFQPENGIIHARLTRQGRFLRLTIDDSGSGIAEKARARLFSQYLRQPGIEDHRHGLGLGLAIVRAVATNHGGTVLITSTKDGGTRTTMTIAIRQDDSHLLRSPLLRPDYTGGFDCALVALADCLSSDHYREL